MQIAAQAKAEGVADLRAAGLKKVKDGLTSLEEINRVTVE
jgi:type IV pilus assembly protein PilB